MTTRNFQPAKPFVTVEMVLRWEPCARKYPESRIRKLADSRTEWSALEIANLDLPVDDLLWLLLRVEVIGEQMCHELACDFAEHALGLIEQPHPDSVEAVAVKRRWINGEATDKELRTAATAATAAATAAWAATATAAWADATATAAGAAAWAAARAAAWADAAARAAAWAAEAAAWAAEAAAGAAAWAAAWTAGNRNETRWQLDRVRKRLSEATHGDC